MDDAERSDSAKGEGVSHGLDEVDADPCESDDGDPDVEVGGVEYGERPNVRTWHSFGFYGTTVDQAEMVAGIPYGTANASASPTEPKLPEGLV